MNSTGEPVERMPWAAGLAVTAAGLCLLLGTASGIARTTGIAFMGVGLVMAVAAIGRKSEHPAMDTHPGEDSQPVRPGAMSLIARADQPRAAAPERSAAETPGPVLTELIDSFNTWCDDREPGETAWPGFDRWVRDALYRCTRARRVRCFHVDDASQRLFSLTSELEEPLWPAGGLPELVAHVLTTGRAYDRRTADGELIQRLAKAWNPGDADAGLTFPAPHGLWPIREDRRTIGLIWVGEIAAAGLPDEVDPAVLRGLLTTFWRHVRQSAALAQAEQTDRTSGVLTRADLAGRAERVLRESAEQGEPAVVLALAVEGIRRLDDQGHWELRDVLMGRIGTLLRTRLRSDDLIGRFSEDRFVAVLRRLDTALGGMIARKLLDAIDEAVREQPVLAEAVRIRCGLSEAGAEGLEAAVGRAFETLRQARLQDAGQPKTPPGVHGPATSDAGGEP